MTGVRIGDGVEFESVEQALLACCHSTRWAHEVAARFPLGSMGELYATADDVFDLLVDDDWLEAFASHPRIGDVEALRERFAASGAMSESEQAGAMQADDSVLHELANGNVEYEAAFGFVFLVRAAGRSAQEILELQTERLTNDRASELVTAAQQQREITHLRLAATFVAAPAMED